MEDRLVALGLAGDAGPHARKRLAAFLRDWLAAIVAFLRALPLRSQRSGAQHGVLHRIVNLVLNRAVAGPSAGHLKLLLLVRRNIGMERATRYRGCNRAFEAVLAHRR